MSILALWYYHTPEGRRFLAGLEIRLILAAAGLLTAYVLLRTRQRSALHESLWCTVGRWIKAMAVATVLC